MPNYKGIEFAKGYNKPFSEFKDEFGSTHVFNAIHPIEREQELKKAYQIATNQKEIDAIEVFDAQTIKPEYGDITATVGTSKEANTRKAK